ncbi:MAG: glycosyltransferase, partial [Acidimicrobiales bacterium]
MGVPLVRLVVLNYNGGPFVGRCVDHLEALDWPAERLQIVVVDNASTDGSDVALEARPRVRLIRSGVNRGFPANNLALTELDDLDYVGLINNDAFVEPGYLAPLVEALDATPGVGAACPKIVLAHRFVDLSICCPSWQAPGDARSLGIRVSGLRVQGDDRWRNLVAGPGVHLVEAGGPDEPAFRWTDGRAVLQVPCLDGEVTASLRVSSPRPIDAVLDAGAGEVTVRVGPTPEWVEVTLGDDRRDLINNAGSRLVRGGYGGDRGFLEPDLGQYDEPQDVFAWCGAGVLFRPDYLRDVGLFDSRYFMYYEDTDLAWRGRLRGWRYRYAPDARLRHIHAATSVEGSPMFNHFVQRNRLMMLTKCAPGPMVRRALAGYLVELARLSWRDIARPMVRLRLPAVGLVRARVRSLSAYLRLLPVLLVDRRRIRRRRTVPDAAITRAVTPSRSIRR